MHQGREGGWGNNINTAWACLALQEFGTNPAELGKAIDYLKAIVNKDGGWGIYPGEASDPFTSALVLWALQEYDPTLPEVAKGNPEGLPAAAEGMKDRSYDLVK